MRIHDNLPKEFFDSPNGISLSDSELHEALETWLRRRNETRRILYVQQMARDDMLLVMGRPLHPCHNKGCDYPSLCKLHGCIMTPP